MKRIYILLLLPLLMATTCYDDDTPNPEYSTLFVLQNNSSFELTYKISEDSQFPLYANSSIEISSYGTSDSSPTLPSELDELYSINKIILNRSIEDGGALAYEQDPIVDNLWVFSQLSENSFQYTLVIINDDLLD